MKKWKSRQNLRSNLRARIPSIVDDYFAAGRDALAAGTAWEQMHRFRVLTKRFRYTLEIFRPAYGPGLDKRIESLRDLQTLLGEINDCVATISMLSSIEGTEAIRQQFAAKAEGKAEKLRALWNVRFQVPGRKESWKRYLTQYACAPGRVRRVQENPPPVAESPA